MRLSPRRFGFAFSTVAGLFYAGCVILMALAGPEKLVFFFNGLFHGLDLSPIFMASVSFKVTLTGFINTILLAWFFGASLAVAYNHSGWLDPASRASGRGRSTTHP
jgi:hypothetical protein